MLATLDVLRVPLRLQLLPASRLVFFRLFCMHAALEYRREFLNRLGLCDGSAKLLKPIGICCEDVRKGKL